MVRVKAQADISKNFVQGSSQAGVRYGQGIQGADWRGPSIDGQALYVAKMADPSVLARRESGIARVSNADWQKAAADKGAAIIGTRMAASVDKQARGWAPYRSALESVTLPAKGPDGYQNLINRAGPIVQAMIQTKAQHG